MARCSVPWANILLEAAKERRGRRGRREECEEGRKGKGGRKEGRGKRLKGAEGRKDAREDAFREATVHTLFFSSLSVTGDVKGKDTG